MNEGETPPRPRDEVIAELVQLSARIDAAVQRQLALIREVHERDLWFEWGLRTITEWLGWRLGISAGTARERVRVALALGKLPAIDAAFAKGQVSFSKVRAMTRVATPENEADLLNCARNATAAQLERICRGMRLVAKNEGERWGGAAALETPEREVSVRGFADGSATMKVVVHRDEAAQLLGVIDRVRAALRHEAGEAAEPTRADALVRMALLANEALDSSVGTEAEPERDSDADCHADCNSDSDAENRTPSSESRRPSPDSENRTPRSDSESRRPNARSRTGADHAMVAFHVQPEMLGDGFAALLDDGSRVPAETLRRVACDCALTATLSDDRGDPLDAGRKTRSISPALRRALDRRDEGCRFPGCRCTRFVHAHHVEHWAHGGETSLGNLVTLCPFHHRLVHEGGFTVAMNAGTPLFRNPRGVPIPDVPAETASIEPPATAPLRRSVGWLPTDIDIDANLFWLQRRPDYRYIVNAMVQ